MSLPSIYSLVPEIARIYNDLIAILPQVAAHTKKFQFAMSQFHQFIQSFSQTATSAPLTQAHVDAYKTILKYAQDYQQLFAAHFLQCWAHSVLENPSNYVPTTLCQIATALQEATMDLDPVGASAFDSSAPQWLQYHILDLKAIDSSLIQYHNDPNADKSVLKIIDEKINSINNFVSQYEGKCVETGGIVFSPIPIIYQSWRLLYSDLEIGEEIGQGVSAHVYIGTVKKTGEKVAIKALKFKKLQGQKLSAFQRELSILASAQHQCLLRFVGATDTPPFCIVTEWMPGSTLYADLNQKHKLDPTDRSIAIFDIARGMKFLHSRHIIHRDLKSLNVLIDGNKKTKICDFGLSRFYDSNDATMTNNIGTPHWMAPELLGPSGQYDTKVDVYAYAILLWEICACAIPYQGLMAPQIIARVLVNDMRPEIPSNVSPALKQLIQECWARDPKARPTFAEIVKRVQKGDIYIEGADIGALTTYINDVVNSETSQISKNFEEIIGKKDEQKLATFIEENGVPEEKFDECWAAVSDIADQKLKVRCLAAFLQTHYSQKAASILRKMPQSAFTNDAVNQIINAFPSGDEEADTSLFICACKNNSADAVLFRAVSPQHIKLGLEVIARLGTQESSREPVMEIAIKYASDSDPMMVAAAIRCLSKINCLDKMPISVLSIAMKSSEPTLTAVATAAVSSIAQNTKLPDYLIDDLLFRADIDPIAVLAIVNACSEPSNAKDIAMKNPVGRMHPTIAASVLIKAAQHKEIQGIVKQQLEKILSQVQDIEIVKRIRATIDAM